MPATKAGVSDVARKKETASRQRITSPARDFPTCPLRLFKLGF